MLLEGAWQPEMGLFTRHPTDMDNTHVISNQYAKVEAAEKRAAHVLNSTQFQRFAVVRHPWARLVATFHVAVTTCSHVRACLKDRYHVPLDGEVTGNVTLNEMLAALLTLHPSQLHESFAPFSDVCELGTIQVCGVDR